MKKDWIRLAEDGISVVTFGTRLYNLSVVKGISGNVSSSRRNLIHEINW